MSLTLTLTMNGLDAESLSVLGSILRDPTGLHTQIAGDTERFLKRVGPGIASGNHRTALALGATPTGHLEDAYQAIEGVASAQGADLLIPRSSRLRAAFGAYTLRPQKSNYLTIPVNREAYGKRAREIEGLVPVRTGTRGTLVLARRTERGLETFYVLTKSAEIPADPTLIPFDELANEAQRSTEEFLDTAIETALDASVN